MREEPDSQRNPMDRKYPVALGLYAVLAISAWFLLGPDAIWINGKLIEIRWIPLLILGAMALKTVLAHHAEKIRRSSGSREER